MNSPKCTDNHIHREAVERALHSMVDGWTATRLSQVFGALSDPSRVRLISALLAGELCVHDLAAALGMSQSAVSHQLRLLRSLNLVRYRKEGRVVYYSLDDEHVEHLFRMGLDHIRHPDIINEEATTQHG
ncbi:MAG: metalloregulator ArsR/SmtB family transcription factor [Chloroflexota bacterium]|nr:MAG: transcription regulator ArsR [Bellilinea sp.]